MNSWTFPEPILGHISVLFVNPASFLCATVRVIVCMVCLRVGNVSESSQTYVCFPQARPTGQEKHFLRNFQVFGYCRISELPGLCVVCKMVDFALCTIEVVALPKMKLFERFSPHRP